MRVVAALLLATGSVVAPRAPASIPTTLRDVRGVRVDVAALASGRRLFVLTVKATSCPVCRAQLARLRDQLGRLESCGAGFLVLAPGPRSAVAALQQDTGFPYPFIADEDLRIAGAVGLALDEAEIVPAILEVDATGRILWLQRGRSADYYGDRELLERLECGELRAARGHRAPGRHLRRGAAARRSGSSRPG
jgi:peroxiredoxin